MQQIDLAVELNVHQSQISRYERGEVIPPGDKLLMLAEPLGLSVHELHDLAARDAQARLSDGEMRTLAWLLRRDDVSDATLAPAERQLIRVLRTLDEGGDPRASLAESLLLWLEAADTGAAVRQALRLLRDLPLAPKRAAALALVDAVMLIRGSLAYGYRHRDIHPDPVPDTWPPDVEPHPEPASRSEP